MSDIDLRKQSNRKYFFAYHLVNGNPYAMMWVEEDGLPVGGIPDVEGDRYEITEEDFNGTLLPLERRFPWKGIPPELPD